MAESKMTIEILADGTIKTTSGKIAPAVHANAEAFLREVARLAGGETTRARNAHAHTQINQQQTEGH